MLQVRKRSWSSKHMMGFCKMHDGGLFEERFRDAISYLSTMTNEASLFTFVGCLKGNFSQTEFDVNEGSKEMCVYSS